MISQEMAILATKEFEDKFKEIFSDVCHNGTGMFRVDEDCKIIRIKASDIEIKPIVKE